VSTRDPARESLARSGSLSLGGSAFAALAALALTALVSNAYGPAGTGVFFQAVAIFTVATQVLKLGTNSALIRFISSRRALTGQTGAWRITLIATIPVIVVSGVVAAALALFSAPLADLLAPSSDAPRLAALLVTMAPYIVTGAVLGVLQTVARLVRGVATFTVLQSITLPLSRLLVAVVVITLALGPDDTFIGWMAVLPVWLVVTVVVIGGPLLTDRRRSRTPDPKLEPTTIRQFWSFSAPRAVGASLETALDWSDVLVVAALTSPADAGIYAVVTRAVRAGQVIDRAMRIAVSPRISHLLALGERGAATRLHTGVTRLLILLSWPFYLALAILGPPVLSLFGDGFDTGATALAILAGAMMVSSASGMLQSVLLQGGRSSWQMYNKAAVLAVNVTLSILFVPVLGIAGAALSWMACLLVDTALAAWQVHRVMGVRLEPRALAPAAALPLVFFGLGCLALRLFSETPVNGAAALSLLVGLPIVALLYGGAVWLLRTRLGLRQTLTAQALTAQTLTEQAQPGRAQPGQAVTSQMVPGNRSGPGASVPDQEPQRSHEPSTSRRDR